MELNTFKSLTHHVSIIEGKYREIAKITGENFNIFRILRLDTSEVRTHSALIAELLNPSGRHGMGNVFLKAFLDCMGITNLDIDKAKVEIEKHIGFKNADSTTGGRMDIVITDTESNAIIIENKIYAADQQNQLLRYKNYADLNYKKGFKIYYLALTTKEASNYSTENNLKAGEDYETLSYDHHIVKWLELCKKEATNYPLLRETISQYINLIKTLTGQSINNNMGKEIVNAIIQDAKTLETANKIEGNMEQARVELLAVLKEQIMPLALRKSLVLLEYDVARNKRYTGFQFNNEEMQMYNLLIRFEFDGKWNSDFAFGFKSGEKSTSANRLIIRQRFMENFGRSEIETTGWPCWLNFEEYRNFRAETFVDILNGKLIAEIEKKLDALLTVFKEAKKDLKPVAAAE